MNRHPPQATGPPASVCGCGPKWQSGRIRTVPSQAPPPRVPGAASMRTSPPSAAPSSTGPSSNGAYSEAWPYPRPWLLRLRLKSIQCRPDRSRV
jgi:hypothetical protein